MPWTVYTPTVGGTAAATVSYARWMRDAGVAQVQLMVTLTAAATGTLSVSLPIAPRAGYPAAMLVGVAEANLGTIYMGPVEISGSTLIVRASDTGLWGVGRPGVWAPGHTLAMAATYEHA